MNEFRTGGRQQRIDAIAKKSREPAKLGCVLRPNALRCQMHHPDCLSQIKKMKLYVVDAFTDRPFSGNPAAICLLDQQKNDDWMQQLAIEMNYSETAFIRRLDQGFELRWFTPAYEVDLCGHATLAGAHVLWNETAYESDQIEFHTRSGVLTATHRRRGIELDFPSKPPSECQPPDGLLVALGTEARFVGRSSFDYLVVVESEDVVRALQPDFRQLREVETRGVIVTSLSTNRQFDFVSRFFAPRAGVDEDPVTGSAHCCLGPYWSTQLDRTALTGFQASHRGGIVQVEVRRDRVALIGEAVTVMTGQLTDLVIAPRNST